MMNTKLLPGANILITGGGRGIGAAIAKGLANYGAKIIIIGRDFKSLQNTKNEINNKKLNNEIIAFKVDVSKFSEIEKLKILLAEKSIKIDVLINNAAGWTRGLFEDIEAKEVDNLIDTTLKGPLWLAQAFIKDLSASKLGNIITITTLGVKPNRSNASPVYLSAKAGVSGLMESLRRYLINYNVKVTEILPGSVASEIKFEEGYEPVFKKYGTSRYPVSDIVDAIIFVLTRSKSAMVEELSIPSIGDWFEEGSRYKVH